MNLFLIRNGLMHYLESVLAQQFYEYLPTHILLGDYLEV
jgi:hypothetical protein